MTLLDNFTLCPTFEYLTIFQVYYCLNLTIYYTSCANDVQVMYKVSLDHLGHISFSCYLTIFSFRHPTLPKQVFSGFDMLFHQASSLNTFICQFKHLYAKTYHYGNSYQKFIYMTIMSQMSLSLLQPFAQVVYDIQMGWFFFLCLLLIFLYKDNIIMVIKMTIIPLGIPSTFNFPTSHFHHT